MLERRGCRGTQRIEFPRLDSTLDARRGEAARARMRMQSMVSFQPPPIHPIAHPHAQPLTTFSRVASQSMSFNDLERGTSGSGGGAGGSRSSPRSNRPTSGGPLPLYHAPRSAYSDHSNDDDGGDHALTAQQKADFKRLADSVGTQIFKINSNTTAVDKLVKLADQKGRQGGGGAGGADATTDWTKRA